MSAGPRLARFQEAAVEHIVARFKDPRGSRRFLLADEVGLGKTIVARGVIDRLSEGRRDGPLRVIYLCSNAEIAEQNRRKLDPAAGNPIGRVTELAFTAKDRDRDVALYSFTPGTSLREGTGLVWERLLLLYLVHRILGEDVRRKDWREYFRCTAGEVGWRHDTRWGALHGRFQRLCTLAFQEELGRAWREGEADGGLPLVRALRDRVPRFDARDDAERRERNRLVGELRGTMQRVALRTLRPHLVILDEVQRFRDVLDAAGDPRQLASLLFVNRVPVLILSATPYRMLTLRHEAEELGESHEDFFRTLEFLFDRDRDTPDRIRSALAAFGRALREDTLEAGRHERLLELKRELEERLRQVVCRTERNWYVLDHKGGVVERRSGDELPGREELEEYFLIRRGLGRHLAGTGEVTEFWKSAPAVVSFLDAGYALLRRLSADGIRLPRALLADTSEIHGLARRNQRLRRLIDLALGPDDAEPPLWTAPLYTYWRDRFFGADPRRKLLVFSGWRFVPKVIAIVASRVAAERLGGEAEAPAQPLHFSDRGFAHVFDLCFPSPALAAAINPRAAESVATRAAPGRAPGLAADERESESEVEAEDVLARAERRLAERLRRARVVLVDGGGDPLWRAVARLDAQEPSRPAVVRAVERRIEERDGDTTPFRTFRDWLDDDRGEIRLARSRLRHLALVAAFSPAVSVYRALCSVYPAADVIEELDSLLTLGFGALRGYLNRPLVQQAIRRHRPRVAWTPARSGDHGYAELALLYAGDAHLLAVLDEYVYVLRQADGCVDIASAIARLADVWSLSRGSRRSNGIRGTGATVRVDPDALSHATHFALAFGEDVARDAGPDDEAAGEPMRKSIVRQAFNSPFWPFVLATTSIGQEGLDFHLYCRDVFHWNLPSNPVDLEQREGRILRRDGLAVRASIARDWPVSTFASRLVDPASNPWSAAFACLAMSPEAEHDRHGLHPHWIYECRDPARTVRIERHVCTFAHGKDAERYERLKSGLALYRLVFGQPDQEDLLDDLHGRLAALSADERATELGRLASYMLYLSPIGQAEARRHAAVVAQEILAAAQTARLERLLVEVHRLRAENTRALDPAGADIDRLVALAESALSVPRGAIRAVDQDSVHVAVSALVYLRDPHDHVFDCRGEWGFEDDIVVIRDACRELERRNSP